MCSFRGSFANRGNGTELYSSDVVPEAGLSHSLRLAQGSALKPHRGIIHFRARFESFGAGSGGLTLAAARSGGSSGAPLGLHSLLPPVRPPQ